MKLYLQSSYPFLVGIPIVLFAALMGFVILLLSEREGKSIRLWRTAEAGLALFTTVLLSNTLAQKDYGALTGQSGPWLAAHMLRRVDDATAPRYPLPLLPLLSVSSALLLFVVARIIYRRRFHKPELSRFSIKEGFDNLPSGGCFAGENGEIVLCNLQMHRLCQSLLGRDLQHLTELRTALATPPEGITCVDEAAHIYAFPDETLWRFSEQDIVDSDGIAYCQVQAFDVTDLYRAEQALKQENAELDAANVRARKLYRELDVIVQEEERLAAQMQLHDMLGRQLLYSRKCLTEEAPLSILRKNGNDWMSVVRLLKNGGEDASKRGTATGDEIQHSYEELLRSAHEVGVDITVEGALPADEKAAYLLLVAIRECTTNTARHAHGNEMTVRLTAAETTATAIITNNGQIPEAPIREGGGLSALRRRVERAGGTMTVQSAPAFALCITLPSRTGKEIRR